MSGRPRVLVFDQAPGFYMDAMCGGVQDAGMVPAAFDNEKMARDELDGSFSAVAATMPPPDASPDGRLISARPVLTRAQELGVPSVLFTDMHGQALIGRRGSQDKYFNNWPMENRDVRSSVSLWLADLEGIFIDSPDPVDKPENTSLVIPKPEQAQQIGRLLFGSKTRLQVGLWIAGREVGEGFFQQDVADGTGISASAVAGQLQNFRTLQMVERGWDRSNYKLNRRTENPAWAIFDMAELVIETIAADHQA